MFWSINSEIWPIRKTILSHPIVVRASSLKSEFFTGSINYVRLQSLDYIIISMKGNFSTSLYFTILELISWSRKSCQVVIELQ